MLWGAKSSLELAPRGRGNDKPVTQRWFPLRSLWSPLTTRNSYKKQQMVHSCGHHFTPQSTNTLQITANARFDQNRGVGGQRGVQKSPNRLKADSDRGAAATQRSISVRL